MCSEAGGKNIVHGKSRNGLFEPRGPCSLFHINKESKKTSVNIISYAPDCLRIYFVKSLNFPQIGPPQVEKLSYGPAIMFRILLVKPSRAHAQRRVIVVGRSIGRSVGRYTGTAVSVCRTFSLEP